MRRDFDTSACASAVRFCAVAVTLLAVAALATADEGDNGPTTLRAMSGQHAGITAASTAKTAEQAKAAVLQWLAGQEQKQTDDDGEDKGDSRQGGDTCATATVIGGLPFSDVGTTVGYADDYDEICPYDAPGSPDVVYSYTPAADETVDISLCLDSAYDTKLYVYENVCGSYQGGTAIACNDDACSTPSYPDPYVSELLGLNLTGGNTYFIVVDGYSGDADQAGEYTIDVTLSEPPPPPPECPPGSLYSAPGQDLEDPWTFGVSDAAFPAIRYDNFFGLGDAICDVHWWGGELDVYAGYANCQPGAGDFEIKFYFDDGTGQPDVANPACSYVVTPVRQETGAVYPASGGTVPINNIYYSVDLTPLGCCLLQAGWISIRSLSPESCGFWWLSSGVGDGASYLDVGAGLQTEPFDLSVCLTGPGEPTGACCYPDGSCEIVTEVECVEGGGVWLGPGTSCSDCPCVITCPPGGIPEAEDCGGDTNGGCNTFPPAFEPINCGDTVCGTAWAVAGTRDTDWYQVTLTEDSILEWTVTSDFPAAAFILDANDCESIQLLAGAYAGGDCTPATAVSECLPAGTYQFFVATGDAAGPIFYGYPCPNDYVGTLTCVPCVIPHGACCLPDGSCVDDVAQATCEGMGGTYQGDDTTCDEVECPQPPPNDLCEDAIGPLDIPSVTPGTTDLATIEDPNTFPYCGTDITSPGVWYTVIGTGTTITASLCNGATQYDSKLSVYCPDCYEPLCVAGNDDFCGLQSEVSWCSQESAEYLILVHGFGGQSGEFELFLSEDGVPCEPTVFCIPVGACCLPNGDCEDGLTEAECTTLEGEYQGDDTACDGAFLGFVVDECGNPFEDISGTGIEAPNASNSDDGGDVVPIGFEFNFYGDVHTQIGISSNGYVTFGDDLTDFSNDAIPDTNNPNDLIAPLWDDLSPNQGGTVHYQTLGTEPNRRFIAQWTAVPQFGDYDENTFQAVLYEGSNCIELRYGDFTPEEYAGDYTIGIENQDGSDGIGIDASTVSPGDCLSFCPEFTDPIECPQPDERVDIVEKGSLLLFPKVELRWDAGGNLIQDTFIDVANDFNEDVWVLAYFVSEACNWVADDFVLTHNEPAYWSAATGLPKGVSPWTVLGDPYEDPEGSGELIMRGYVVLWAINPAHEEIRWNHLYGQATIVNYLQSSAWEYNAYAFRAFVGENGEQTGDPGLINLDGVEFDNAFNKLLLDFFASGSTAFSGGGKVVMHDTDLTLVIVDMDLRQETEGPYVTKADFEIWNENEVSFSGMHYCFTKWDQSLLGSVGGHFLVENLQTNKGRARIDGIGSEVVCGPESADYAILGVAAKVLTYDGSSVATAGMNLFGTGLEATSILYDLPEPPDEKSLSGDTGTKAPLGAVER